jgi:hypothetical protein
MEEFRQGKINFDVLDEEDNFFAQQAPGEAGTEAVTGAGENAGSESDLGAEEDGGEEVEAESDS